MKFFFSAVVFFIATISFSQESEFVVSAPYPVIDAIDKSYFSSGDEIMAVKTNPDQVIIQKWSAGNLNEIQRKEYRDFERGFQLEDVREFGGNYYLFYSVWDKRNKREQLYSREIDFESGTFKMPGKLMLEVEGKVTNAAGGSFGVVAWGPIATIGTVGKFNIQRSYDESKVLVQYRKYPEKRRNKKNYDVIGFSVFDNRMNSISQSEVKMPYTEAQMDNLDYAVDAAGNSYLLALVYNSDNERLFNSDGSINYHMQLMKLPVNSQEMSSTPIEIEDVTVSKLLLFNMTGDEMVCAGYYSRGTDQSNATGVITFKMNEGQEVTDVKTYDFPVDLHTSYNPERRQRKIEKWSEEGSVTFTNVELRGLTVMRDGSLLLTGEQSYIEQKTSYMSSRSRTYYVYHYDNILVTKIGTDGELQWMRKLPKQQYGGKGVGGMSFVNYAARNAHYFLYLDNVKNMSLPLDQEPATHVDGMGGYFTAFKINDKDGETAKRPLFDLRDVHGMPVDQFAVSRIIPVSDDVFCVEVYKKDKEDIMIKVKADL